MIRKVYDWHMKNHSHKQLEISYNILNIIFYYANIGFKQVWN